MNNNHKQPTSIVVFGSTGDLAKRKLFPAFFNLFLEGWMPDEFEIISLGRNNQSQDEFKDYILENIKEFSRIKDFSEEKWQIFKEKIYFLQFDINQEDSFNQLREKVENLDKKWNVRANRLFYLSIAPSFIDKVSKSLKNHHLAEHVEQDRLIIEKPFGYDKATAVELNNLLAKTFQEEQIYRIDHYLGKENVQNILAFRFGNIMFEPLWNNKYIDSVQITVAETVGVEDRGGYYDGSGALRDMIQNHLMQILCMVAMEAPKTFESTEIRDRKVELLKSVRRIDAKDVNHYTVRAQYTKGELNGKMKPGYLQEKGVDPHSNTETYVAMKFYVDNERWKGVPFYMRTGKSMAEKKSYITINFKDVPNTTFKNGKSNLVPNVLTIDIQPETSIKLLFMTKKPGLDMKLKPAEMIFDYFECAPDTPEAYETLLLDALDGDSTLFMRSDQVEEAWDVISTIQESWQNGNDSEMYTYPVGSNGPEAADELLKRQGHFWLDNSNITDKN
ncbi:glucose-6-phosphate dehydrogenase [Empedobacter brevis]|uniref:glucose-6-phosphate dehydrogenase n=1 Tax=Empedobacter brevis TaxID=247 RepID=UPI0039AF1215